MGQSTQSPFSASLDAVTTLFAELRPELPPAASRSDSVSAFEAVTRTAVRRIEGARAASMTTLRSGQFQTVAATDDRALLADAIQYELGSGPCVDAIRETPSTGRAICAPIGVGGSTGHGCRPRWGSSACCPSLCTPNSHQAT